jgi:hypothetical protein
MSRYIASFLAIGELDLDSLESEIIEPLFKRHGVGGSLVK